MSIFSRRRRPVLLHPYFGNLRYMGGYWEGELVVADVPEGIGLVIPAGEDGPTLAQADFCRSLLGDLDALFEHCKPVFESDFETWARKPFPQQWRDEFSLVSLDLPRWGDEAETWTVSYFVHAASHYFTAYFEGGGATHNTIDG